MEPTISQIKATARFHRRMESIFTAQGKTSDAESARKAAEQLEKRAEDIENAEQENS